MCTCNRLIGVVCPAHCNSSVCRDGEHVDLCAGPTRNRQLELLHRLGYAITPEVIAAVLSLEGAVRKVLDDAGVPTR